MGESQSRQQVASGQQQNGLKSQSNTGPIDWENYKPPPPPIGDFPPFNENSNTIAARNNGGQGYASGQNQGRGGW